MHNYFIYSYTEKYSWHTLTAFHVIAIAWLSILNTEYKLIIQIINPTKVSTTSNLRTNCCINLFYFDGLKHYEMKNLVSANVFGAALSWIVKYHSCSFWGKCKWLCTWFLSYIFSKVMKKRKSAHKRNSQITGSITSITRFSWMTNSSGIVFH